MSKKKGSPPYLGPYYIEAVADMDLEGCGITIPAPHDPEQNQRLNLEGTSPLFLVWHWSGQDHDLICLN